jgi:hypothetical protein
MATDNRGGSRKGNRGRSGRNNNPDGRNQYSGMMSTASDNPFATAAAIGGAVAAGAFLWSRRNQISEQIGNLADQIRVWREDLESSGYFAADDTTGESFMATSGSRRRRGGRSQAEISEEALTLKEIGETA